MANKITRINVGGNLYDINATYFGDKTVEEWESLISHGLKVVVDSKHASKEEPATPASAETEGKIYLVTLTGQLSGTYTEFLTVVGGTTSAPTYTWEKIGTTDTDLSQYVKKGNYTTAVGGAGETGNAGAATLTSSGSGSVTLTPTISAKYLKSATETGSAGGATVNTTSAGGATVNGSSFSFAGKASTITGAVDSLCIEAHNYTPEGTISKPGITLTSAGKTFNTDAIKAVTSTFTGTEATITSQVTFRPYGDITGSQTLEAHGHTVTSTPATKKGVKVKTTAASTGTVGLSGGSITPATGVDVVTGVTAATLSSATTTSTGAVKYLESITGSKATLGGTTTFNTNAIKDVSLSASTTSTDGPAYIEAVSLPTMTAINFTPNTLQSINVTNYGFVTQTRNVMTAPTVSVDGVLSWTLEDACTGVSLKGGSAAALTGGVFTAGSKTTKYMKHTNTAADSGTVSVSGGEYTATTKYAKVSGGSASGSTTVIPSYTYEAPTLTGTTTFAKSGLATAALAEDTSTTPAFSFNTDAIKSVTLSAVSGGTVDFTKASFSGRESTGSAEATYQPEGSISNTYTAASTDTVNNVTAAALNATPTFTGKSATLSHNTTAGTVSFEYTPEGTITGSATIAAHSHSVTISGHTHSISLTKTDVTDTTASVTVPEHTHTVTVANHKHSVAGHTHGITL